MSNEIDNDEKSASNNDNDSVNNSITSHNKSKLLKQAKKYQDNINKRGVIYLSRIPPYMKPNKARNIFESFGTVTRLYLAEETKELRHKRIDNGGNSSKQFCEGWIEYADKSIAKQVAESLNNTPIAGRKGDFYHDDLWNIKYLHKFKWDYLTEKFAYERRIKENKLKLSTIQDKKANQEFAELVDKTIALKHIEERKRKRNDNQTNSNDVNNDSSKNKKLRTFRQKDIISNQYGENKSKVNNAQLIQNIFVKKD